MPKAILIAREDFSYAVVRKSAGACEFLRISMRSYGGSFGVGRNARLKAGAI
jgi:hypothetical protein